MKGLEKFFKQLQTSLSTTFLAVGLCSPRLFVGLLFVGCATAPQGGPLSSDQAQLDIKKNYRLDLKVTVNNVTQVSAQVVPLAPRYELKVEAPGDSDFVTLTSCGQQIILNNKDDKFKYTFTRSPEEERKASCPLLIEAYSPKFRFSGAFIDFSNEALPVTQTCNGWSGRVGGVTACQSKAGVLTWLAFDTEVEPGLFVGKCNQVKELEKGKRYEITISSGYCVYAFREKAQPNRFHRLTTYGYDEFLLYR